MFVDTDLNVYGSNRFSLWVAGSTFTPVNGWTVSGNTSTEVFIDVCRGFFANFFAKFFPIFLAGFFVNVVFGLSTRFGAIEYRGLSLTVTMGFSLSGLSSLRRPVHLTQLVDDDLSFAIVVDNCQFGCRCAKCFRFIIRQMKFPFRVLVA